MPEETPATEQEQAPGEGAIEDTVDAADAGTPESAERPKSPKRWIRWVAVVVVVALAAAGGGYMWWTAEQEKAAEAQAARLAAVVDEADDLLETVLEQIEVRERAWLGTDTWEALDTLPSLVTSTRGDLEKWSASLDQVEELMVDCSDPELADDYLQICADLRDAFVECDEDLAPTKEFAEACGELDDAETRMLSGHRHMNDAVDACNKKQWSTGTEEAQAAQADYAAALALYKEIEPVLGAEEMSELVTWASGYVEVAKMQEELAALGRRGSINGYNAQITKIENQEDAAGGRYVPDYDFDGGWIDAEMSTNRLFKSGRDAAELLQELQESYIQMITAG